MSTKPKLKKIPLPEGLAKLPKGAVFLGDGVSVNPGKPFVGWCYNSGSRKWVHGEWGGGFASSYYAAPADSAIAREILGEPAKPVTKRKAAKKTITKPSKTVTKSRKAQKTITLRKLPKNVKPGTKVVCIKECGSSLTLNKTYVIGGVNSVGMVRLRGGPTTQWWMSSRFCLAPSKPEAKKTAKREGPRSTSRSLSLEPSPPETPKERASREWIDRLRKFGASTSTIITAQNLAGSPVEIIHSDETGEWLWAVTDEYEFWFDAFRTEQEAKDFVAAMEWPMIGGEKPATDNAGTHIELHQKEIDIIGRTEPYTAEELAIYWAKKGEEMRQNSAVGLLTEAAETIGARAAERDVESERSMAKCVAAFNVMFGKDITEEQGWLFMALLKMSRSTVGHRRDDFLDGAAYMSLAGESALDQEKP